MTPKKPEAAKPEPQKEVQQTAPAPSPTTTPAPVVAAVAQPQPAPTKQQLKLEELKAAWVKRGDVDLSKLTTTVDGKYLNVSLGAGWPLIVLGPTGGVNLPEIKSYPSAFPAAIEGDKLLAKQNARSQKPAAPAAPVVVTVKASVVPAAQPEAKTAESPAAKKQAQHKQIEDRLQA